MMISPQNLKERITMSKYAVFYDDGLDEVYDDKDQAKAHAAKLRKADRAEGRRRSCYFKKLTREEEEMLG